MSIKRIIKDKKLRAELLKKYRDYKDMYHKTKQNGVFYAFDKGQFIEGMLRENYITKEDADKGYDHVIKIANSIGIRADNYGGYGSKEAFLNQKKELDNVSNLISNECKSNKFFAEAIFIDEYANHECGYTGDAQIALDITREYAPNFKLTQSLLDYCRASCNCW